MSDKCDNYVEQLFAYLDGELTPAQQAELKAHLEDCPPCLDEYQRDALLKALVRRSCVCEEAPVALRAQIMTTITTQITSMQITTVQVREF